MVKSTKNVLKRGYAQGNSRKATAPKKKGPIIKKWSRGPVSGKGKPVKRKPTKSEYDSMTSLTTNRTTKKAQLLGTYGSPHRSGMTFLNKPKSSQTLGNTQSRDNFSLAGGLKKTRGQTQGSHVN
jgi:hypothetical protein